MVGGIDMELKTKFNVKQKVYVLFNDKVDYRRINGIKIIVNDSGEFGIQYRLSGLNDYSFRFDENELFTTKEELLKSL